MRIKSASRLPLLGMFALLAACSGNAVETTDECVARFATHVENAKSLGGATWLGNYTYELEGNGDMPDPAEFGEAKPAAERPHITISSGNSDKAVEAFTKGKVPAGGAFFFSEDVSLFRTAGSAGTLEETVYSGCTGGPQNSKLIRIDWVEAPKDMNT
ncbi:hypothetical protein K3152_03320 [Qipengyuania sp. 1NDH17]|uniref:Lipoprotein n=1 Tax=Qipengyuania polymorpha TaxID=2867234 RepID=A0ABS7IV07_9SPHN|nr:hypothetical protein [Qipengyuania polymorpha]MBX7457267.1 hypothetical protein [Qipengyuania polymorpha]